MTRRGLETGEIYVLLTGDVSGNESSDDDEDFNEIYNAIQEELENNGTEQEINLENDELGLYMFTYYIL